MSLRAEAKQSHSYQKDCFVALNEFGTPRNDHVWRIATRPYGLILLLVDVVIHKHKE
jgi:hypothetical protein